MDRYRRLSRRLYLFAGVFALGLVLVVVRAAATVEVPTGKALPQVFPPIDFNALRVVEVEKTPVKPGDGKEAKSLRLERTGVSTWVVASSDGFPADHKKVEDFVKGLSEVRSLAEVTTSPEKFPTFAGDDGFTDVRLYAAASEEPSHAFGIGKANALGSWSNTFLRVDEARRPPLAPGGARAGGGRVLAVKGVDAWVDRTDLLQWIEPRFFPGLADADLVEVTWTYAPKSFHGVLTRGTRAEGESEDPFVVSTRGPDGAASAPAAAKRDPAKQIVSGLSGLRLAGVVGRAGEGSDATYGFDAPSLVVVGRGKAPSADKPAPIYRIEVGKKVEGKSTYYARRSLLVSADPWVFTVNEYELGRLTEDPVELLEKKPEPPPPPSEAPATPTTPTPTEDEEVRPPTPAEPGAPEAPPGPPGMDDAPAPPDADPPK